MSFPKSYVRACSRKARVKEVEGKLGRNIRYATRVKTTARWKGRSTFPLVISSVWLVRECQKGSFLLTHSQFTGNSEHVMVNIPTYSNSQTTWTFDYFCFCAEMLLGLFISPCIIIMCVCGRVVLWGHKSHQPFVNEVHPRHMEYWVWCDCKQLVVA